MPRPAALVRGLDDLLQPHLSLALMADDEAFAESSRLRHVAGRVIGLLIVVSAIVVGLYVLRLYYVYPRTDDAYVRANVVGVAPHVSGPIVELPIHDNQHVAKGALLFVVDPRPYQAALERAEASLTLTNLQSKRAPGRDPRRPVAPASARSRRRLRQAVSQPYRSTARAAFRHRQRRLQRAEPSRGGPGGGRKLGIARCAGRKTNSANTATSTRGARTPRPPCTTPNSTYSTATCARPSTRISPTSTSRSANTPMKAGRS